MKKWMTGALLVLLAAPLHAQVLRIEITQGVSGALPVAVVPFAWDGAGAQPIDASAVIAANLQRSGRFRLFPEADMVDRPTEAARVNFQTWRAFGVDNLVIGRVRQTSPGNHALQFQLFDVLRGQQLLGYSIPTSATNLRRAAHIASDMIYEQLTGERGAFATRIAFINATRTAEVSSYVLFVADADGENQQVVVRSPEPLMSPAWSPDGRRLAYVSFENRRPEVFVQELATGTRERVSALGEGVNGAPAWSADGRRLALALNEGARVNIYVLDMETRRHTRVTNGSAIDTEPVFSADGRFIYFTSDRGGQPQIYRAAVDGDSRAQRVTFEGNYNARPALSPDGRLLAVVNGNDRRFRIGLYDLETGAFRLLSDGRFDESPSFAPNGRLVIYATEDRGTGVLATVSVDGRVRQRLGLAQGDVREPAWSPYTDATR
ncbi:MAG: Tol-Pal system beta propeller repeat protein TolB [Xanthomonadaceae bacterium]|nr:Tol-Pal system beta propeller repeat protein TolB [Xanthomonadaceae bacterium]